jgi:hypothetical protein
LLLLVGVPLLLLWVGTMQLSSVAAGLALAAAWCLCCCVPLRSSRDVALLAFSSIAAFGVAEMLLRTSLQHMAANDPVTAHFVGRTEGQDNPIKMADPDLGFRVIPNNRVHVVVRRDGTLVYDVVYTTDAYGFRQDGLPPRESSSRVAILGDSFAFGEGLNDDQTLGHFFKKHSFGAVNLGMPGAGPHQSLRQLELGEPRKSPGSYSHILLTVMDDHIARVNGLRPWLLDTPCYEVGLDENLRLLGTFRPSYEFAHSLLVGSRIAALTTRSLTRNSQAEEALFVGVLREINRVARTEYDAPLLVAYYAGRFRGDLVGNRAKMLDLFRRAGVAVLDVLAAAPEIAADIDRYFIPFDGHPTAELNKLVVDLAVKRFAAD